MRLLLVHIAALFAVAVGASAVPSKDLAALVRRTDNLQELPSTSSSENSGSAPPELLADGFVEGATLHSSGQTSAGTQVPKSFSDRRPSYWCGYGGLPQCCSNMDDPTTCEEGTDFSPIRDFGALIA